MVHFMVKRGHFYNLPPAFLDITSKPDMLQIFGADIPVIMHKKKDKFYIYIL